MSVILDTEGFAFILKR